MTAKKPSATRRKDATPVLPTPPPSVNETLMKVQAVQPDRVLVIHEKGSTLDITASHMTVAQALWLVKQAEMQVLGVNSLPPASPPSEPAKPPVSH